MNASRARALLSLVPLVMLCALAGCSPQNDLSVSPSPGATIASSPPVNAEPFVGSKADYAQALVSCVGEQGWPGTITGPDDPEGAGAIRWDPVPESQDNALNDAIQSCIASLGQFDDAPASEEEVRARYDAFMDQYNCLIAAGFGPTDPPSFASYLDEFQTSGTLMWDPVSGLSDEQYVAATKACPRP